jgi:hypothetical protein
MTTDLAFRSPSMRLWIPAGAALFIVALAVSAWMIPQLRLLHFLQAFIYVAIVILARRNSAWSFGAGAIMAVAWNSLNLFVTHNTQAGLVALWSFLHTGRAQRPLTIVILLGGIGHLVLMLACLSAILHLRTEEKKWWKFAGGGVVALAYLGLIVAIAKPR